MILISDYGLLLKKTIGWFSFGIFDISIEKFGQKQNTS